jgi:hypothetical protein
MSASKSPPTPVDWQQYTMLADECLSDDGELRQLAGQRASSLMRRLLDAGRITSISEGFLGLFRGLMHK